MIKACIFDLDGTLAYTLDSMAVVGNEVVRKYGLKPMPIENYRYYCGNGADMLVKRLLVDAGDPELLHYEEARALYRKEFDKDPFYKIQHYPGMPETLKELKKRGFKFIGSTTLYAFLEAVGIINDHVDGCFRKQEVACKE